MGLRDKMDLNKSDSDSESYITPPESNQEESSEDIITVEDNNPINANMAELTEDEPELDNSEEYDSELDDILNNPSNDTTIELGNLLNLPDTLDNQGTQSDTSLSDDLIQGSTQKTPTKRSRPHSPLVHHPWSSHPSLKDTILTPL